MSSKKPNKVVIIRKRKANADLDKLLNKTPLIASKATAKHSTNNTFQKVFFFFYFLTNYKC
jgi:hypothetical protein